MKYTGKTGEYFEVLEFLENQMINLKPQEGVLSILWFKEENNILEIDGREHHFEKDQVVCLTNFNKIKFIRKGNTSLLRFNSPFYCILQHDREVGCKGVLFYGSSLTPIIKLDQNDKEVMESVWKVLSIEMNSRDNLQLEMLQMLLKRIVILITRIYKQQENYQTLDPHQSDLIREFHFLVEQHFKEKHAVSEYATLLNKSPKTLSNLFGKLHDKTPSQMIQQRIMHEVRRLLAYTDQPISEIGYDVGFNDLQSFSRFFKKHEGISPSDFRISFNS